MKTYKCPAGVWTIGYGNTSYLKGYTKPETQIITQEIADELLQNDIQIYYNCVIKNVGEICNSNQIYALTSFCFNVGVGAFEGSTLLKVIKRNPNHMPEIQTQFMK